VGVVIVFAFPAPPSLVAHVLTQLRIVRSGDADAIADLGDVAELARPWLPATCGDQLRHHLWMWCDEVVNWINQQYVWRGTQLIPECWPQHPHIANELPALACQRVHAEDSAGADLVEEWHRHTLPLFLDRVATRLGDSCRASKHVDWPAAGRYDASQSEASIAARQDLYYVDTHPPRQLRPAKSPT
jgi:hypothetical protein